MLIFILSTIGFGVLTYKAERNKSDKPISGLVGGIAGALVGGVLVLLIGIWLPYTTVSETQQLVGVQSTQGTHQSYFVSSGTNTNKKTTYSYNYVVPGGFNTGYLTENDGAITIQQNALSGQETLTHQKTVFAEGFFILFGMEHSDDFYNFSVSQGGYHPGDQLNN